MTMSYGKKVMRETLDDWIKSMPMYIDKKEIFVAGGAISSLVQGERPNDYDVYVKTGSYKAHFLNNYQYDETAFVTDNAITLPNGVQIITRFHGPPEHVVRSFDFRHTQNFYDYGSDEIVLNNDSVMDIAARRLVYMGSEYPLASLFRVKKFIERGWKITAGQLVKIAMDIQTLDLRNPQVLREQLIGVDILYFATLLKSIEAGNHTSANQILELIDEMES